MTQPSDKVDAIIKQWAKERPDLGTDALRAMAIIGRLKRCATLLTPQLEQVHAEFGLSMGEFDVLATLRRAGAPYILTPTQLQASLMVTGGAVTHRLKLLQHRGLIERKPNPDDSRSMLVKLSPKGRKLIDSAIVAHVDNEKKLTEALSFESQQALDHALKEWLQWLEPTRTD